MSVLQQPRAWIVRGLIGMQAGSVENSPNTPTCRIAHEEWSVRQALLRVNPAIPAAHGLMTVS